MTTGTVKRVNIMDKIAKIPGEAPELYARVAPLAMSISCLRENNNYPYKTSGKHVWYIILCRDRTTAFMPVEEIGGGKYKIDNYYASATEGRERQLGRLVEEILSDYKGTGILFAVVQTRDLKVFASYGFTVSREWKRYVKMCFEGEAYGNS
ncbi:hypothetical protein SDC9_196798 [bioreactor metagenome]|jgi:hypothetical protein|uniref:N-acetyltransferase domain-containing protein n=1 Tax=bioreactor metagenome TaxID=1076179 RepID=A0A645IPL2_9ZZZZ